MDDEGRLAAELQVNALEVRGGQHLDAFARFGIAGQRDEVDVRVRGERRTNDVAAAGHNVEHPVGHAGLCRELAEPNRRQRGRRGRLDDDAIARCERGRDLPDRHPERVVPRRNLADDTDGFAPDEAGVRAAVLVRGLALEVADLRGEEPQVVGGEGEVAVAPQLVRRPGLERFDAGQLVGMLVDEVSEPVQNDGSGGQQHA
jgi:hypothetical protein